jgi:hypothetical protein
MDDVQILKKFEPLLADWKVIPSARRVLCWRFFARLGILTAAPTAHSCALSRIATRYEKTARAYLSVLCIAAARLGIKTVDTA